MNTSTPPSVWELIKQQRFDEAVVRADAEFAASQDPFVLHNKVFALLLLGKVDEAISLSEELISRAQREADSDFIFLGVGHWLKGDKEEAIKSWTAGLRTNYTDAAGGVQIPMLLFFAAVRTNDENGKRNAARLLKNLARSRTIVNWPGPVAQFILGTLSEPELRSRMDSQPVLREKQACQVDFYVGVKKLEAGDKIGFRELLQKAAGHGLVCSVKAEPYLAVAELKTYIA